MALFRSLIVAGSQLPFVEKAVRHGRPFKPMVERFIAGDTADQAMMVADDLASQGFFVSLDLLGENCKSEEEAAKNLHDYIELVGKISKSSHCDAIYISIKLTALGLDQGEELAEQNYRTLLKAAKPSNTFIRADMEGSPYTEQTVSMLERVHPDFDFQTGTVLQSYLYRSDADIERLMKIGCRLRWVKGAYLEPASIAYQAKEEVDREYLEGCKKLLLRARYPAIATHDEDMINSLKKFIADRGIAKESFEWQMLYGIRRDLQQQLLDEGFNVRIYVPYGQAWYPYFSRRLAERPANLFFILRSLFGR